MWRRDGFANVDRIDDIVGLLARGFGLVAFDADRQRGIEFGDLPISASEGAFVVASAMTARTSSSAASQSSPNGTILIKVPSIERLTSSCPTLACR